MNNYGYTTDKTKLPEDNIWISGNELTLNDDIIVNGNAALQLNTPTVGWNINMILWGM